MSFMAKKNYDDLARQIVENVGGVNNISDLYHCVTRLRFLLKDDSKADTAAIKKLNGVLSVVIGNGQYQIVIGNAVADVFDTISRLYSIKAQQQIEKKTDKQVGNVLTRALNVMSSIVNPVVTALAGAGMIKALLSIFVILNWIDKAGSTYAILSAASNSVFYFLPLFLAISSAKAFNVNIYISLAIVAALMEPNFTKLMKTPGDTVSFLGVPVVLMSYTGTLIPAIVSIYVYSKLEKMLKTFIPKSIDLFATSMLALLIMVPLSMIVIGPLGVTAANFIGEGVNMLSDKAGMVTGGLIGGSWTYLVMFGIHWGIVPIMISNISNYGYDVIRPMVAAATFASAGAAFGAFLRLRQKENKAFALSAIIPALLGGITEPIVYGISVKYKKPLIAQTIGGAAAGMFMGMMKTKAYVYVFPALTTLPAFVGETFAYYLVGITMAFGITAILTYILGMDEEIEEEMTPAVKNTLTLNACVNGSSIALASVNDPVFSGKSLGDGVAFLPEEGALFAPMAGIVEAIFPTGHAIGMRTADGVEILMHIGINTVDLEGKGFKVLVQQGDTVGTGQKLVEFNKDFIIAAGYDITTMMCITNMSQIESIHIAAYGKVTTMSEVLEVKLKEE
jgi:PTS system beta-glucosides-specific IIC component